MSRDYYHPIYHLVPRPALESALRGRPVAEGARAIRPARLLVPPVRLVVGLLWPVRGLAHLVVLCNRYGTPAARADHR